jgi:hypothetical protein
MKFSPHLGAVVLVLCGAGATAGLAETPADVASVWGLLGTWAVDCSQPASRQNSYLSFVRNGDGLVHRRGFGGDSEEHAVMAVRVTADGRIEVVIDLRQFSQVRTIVFAKEGEGKKRAVSNRDDKGVYSIRDGKFVANGQRAPVQGRCANLTN